MFVSCGALDTEQHTVSQDLRHPLISCSLHGKKNVQGLIAIEVNIYCEDRSLKRVTSNNKMKETRIKERKCRLCTPVNRIKRSRQTVSVEVARVQ